MISFIPAFVGHLVGDYAVQTDWMGQNKKQHTWPCFVHCITYTVALALIILLASVTGHCEMWPWWALGIAFVQHFLADRFNWVPTFAKWTGRSKFVSPTDDNGKPNMFFPWSYVMVDNTSHIVTLFLISLFV